MFSGSTDKERIRSYRAFVDAKIPAAMRSFHPAGDNSSQSAEAVPALEALEREHLERKAVILAAWACGAYSREQIARHFGISTKTVTRLVASVPGIKDIP
jgi:DNA-binding NarL/FixJ family response regulator